MPAKYREIGDFHAYYSGARKAPYLTIFVGGNHEASNYLFELYYGGWAAPNIYYMGASNVLNIGGLRIAGMSGIWKGYNYRKPHHERLPYNNDDVRSIYHVRELDVRKLMQVRTQVDVGISHDWPNGVEWKGNYKKLFKQKDQFEDDARSGRLGSVAAKQVMDRLRPRHWFAAHLHCKFAAVIEHGNEDKQPEVTMSANEMPVNAKRAAQGRDDAKIDPITNDADATPDGPGQASDADTVLPVNADEIDLELEDADGSVNVAEVAPGQGLDGFKVPLDPAAGSTEPTVPEDVRSQLPASFARPPQPTRIPENVEHPPNITNKTTNFLALDKCLPYRDFLQLLFLPTLDSIQRPVKLEYDREWLAITRAFVMAEPVVLSNPRASNPPPRSQKEYAALIDAQQTWVDSHFSDSDLIVPENFQVTAQPYDGRQWKGQETSQEWGGLHEYTNNQTVHYCEMLQIPNAFKMSEKERATRMAAGPRPEEERKDGGFGRGRGRGGGRGGHRGGGRGSGRGRGRGR